MQANIITRNLEKMLTAKNVFDRYDIATNFIDKDYVEIQADTTVWKSPATPPRRSPVS